MTRLSWPWRFWYHWLWQPSWEPLPQKIPHQNPLQNRQSLPQTSFPPCEQLWQGSSHRWSSLQGLTSSVPHLQMILPQNRRRTSGKQCQCVLGYLIRVICLGSSRMNLIDVHCFRGFFFRARVLVRTGFFLGARVFFFRRLLLLRFLLLALLIGFLSISEDIDANSTVDSCRTFLAFSPAAAATVVAAATTALAAVLVFSTFVAGFVTRPPSPFFFAGAAATGLLFVLPIL